MRMMTTQETRYLFRRRNRNTLRRKGKRRAVRMTMKITVMNRRRVLNMRMRARRRKSLAKVEANY